MQPVRVAVRADIGGMQRVRRAVRENRLVSTVIRDADVQEAIERTGRGWVVEADGELVGFAIGNRDNGSIWALFVHPDHEGRGYGSALHDAMVAWLWTQGLDLLWLTTEPGTRAQRFYERAGWVLAGAAEHGELRFELRRAGSREGAADRP